MVVLRVKISVFAKKKKKKNITILYSDIVFM